MTTRARFVLVAVLLSLLASCGGGGAAIQAPTIKDWWQGDFGTQWLYEPTRQHSFLIRVDAKDEGLEIGGAKVTSFVWYRGAEADLWPSADPTTSQVAPFQNLYFTYTKGKGVRYYGRDSLEIVDAWADATTYDTPIQFAADEIAIGETADTEIGDPGTGGTTWHSSQVAQETHTTFYEPNMETLVLDLTEDSGTAPEAGRYWLSPYRGIVAFEIAAYPDTDAVPIRFDLTNYLD